MTNDKVATYLGFAIKAGKATFGTDAILRSKRKPPLIVIDESLSENAAAKLVRFSERTTVAVSESVTVAQLTHREGCKAVAINDERLAEAIVKNMNGCYRLVTEVR